MKKYTKPTAEIREFVVTNKLASLEDWLNNNSAEVGDVTVSNITSYTMASNI